MCESLFVRCGGFAKVRRVVQAFYGKVVRSPLIGGYFKGSDMRRLIDHQTKFVAGLMGGPAGIPDEALRRAHERLGITENDFHEMARLLCETLEEAGLSPADVATVLQEVRRREPLIVSQARGLNHG